MTRNDWFIFIGFILIIVGVMSLTYYFFVEKVNDCTSDPIKFAVEKIKEMYEVDSVYGTITVNKDEQSRSWSFGDTPKFNLSLSN